MANVTFNRKKDPMTTTIYRHTRTCTLGLILNHTFAEMIEYQYYESFVDRRVSELLIPRFEHNYFSVRVAINATSRSRMSVCVCVCVCVCVYMYVLFCLYYYRTRSTTAPGVARQARVQGSHQVYFDHRTRLTTAPGMPKFPRV